MAKNVREVKFKDNDVDVVVTITTEEDGTSRFQAPAGYKMYPMDLDGIKNPSLYGYDRDLIMMWPVGEKKRLSYMVPVKETIFNPLIAPDKAEDKRNERKRKCMVPGKNGALVMCREASCMKSCVHFSSKIKHLKKVRKIRFFNPPFSQKITASKK